MLLALLAGCAPVEPCGGPAAHATIASGSVWWVRDKDVYDETLESPCALVQADAENVDVPGIPLDVDVDQAGLCSDAVAAAAPGTVPVAGAGPARIPASIAPTVTLATGGHTIAVVPDEPPTPGRWALCCKQTWMYESEVVAADIPVVAAGTRVTVTQGEPCAGTMELAIEGAPDFLSDGGCVSFASEFYPGRHVKCAPSPALMWEQDLPLQGLEILNGDGTVVAGASN